MVPKAFPYPIGVGTDICQVHRIAAILRRRETRERWARRAFTRLEWPSLWRAFQQCQLSTTDRGVDSVSKKPQAMNSPNEKIAVPAGVEPAASRKSMAAPSNLTDQGDTGPDPNVWLLPNLSTCSAILDNPDPNTFSDAIVTAQSPLGVLARYLAGRWAAKEAVIKAHSHRRLYMQDISILVPRHNLQIWTDAFAERLKPVALIDPPCQTILMDEKVAGIRALRGFGRRSQGLDKRVLPAQSEPGAAVQEPPANREQKKNYYYERRSKVKESDRQLAEISLSHDGNNAIAVCMAFDEPIEAGKPDRVIDDGKWLPVHEPQWGDEGWLAEEESYDGEDEPESGGDRGISKNV